MNVRRTREGNILTKDEEGTTTPEAHKGLAEGYVSDPRFTAYYNKIAPGCAVFLRDAIAAYVGSGEGK